MQKITSTIDRSPVLVLAGVTEVNAISPDVPVPASATRVTDWPDWNGRGTRERLFVCTSRADRVRVVISRAQFAGGSPGHVPVMAKAAYRWAPANIDASTARALTAELLAAADEMDTLNGVAR